MILLRDSDDEQALRSAFGQVFTKFQTSAADHAQAEANRTALWSQLAEMGALAMAAPERLGGGNASLTQLCVLAEEAGANVDSGGLVEHLTATRFLSADSGTAYGVVPKASSATISLRPSRSGRWPAVLTSAGPSLVLGVHGDAVGILRLAGPPADGHFVGPVRISEVAVDDQSFTPLGPPARFRMVLDTWRVLTAAYLIGICDYLLARTVTYVCDRHQFGKPVGAYQSVAHGLADLPGMISGARLLTGKAAWSVDNTVSRPITDLARNEYTDPGVLAAMALLFAADTANAMADRAVHYHGAIGAAVETGIHNYYRIVRTLPLLAGPMSIQRRELADLILEPMWTSR